MKDRMKVYHGVPKSVTDENTVFYASFDGSVKPEIGSISNYPNGILIKPNLTGYGVYNSSAILPTELVLKPSTKLNGDITMEFCITNQVKSNLTRIVRLNFGNIDLDVIYHFGSIKFRFMGIPNPTTIEKAMDIFEISHVRFTLRCNEMRGFVNGTLIGVKSVDMTNVSLTNEPLVYINRLDTNNASSSICISDLHISNIDRGDFFPNLPQDFIEGKAIIKEKFGQQQIKGDPMCSQVTDLRVPCWNGGSEYDLSSTDTQGFTRLKSNPECKTSGSASWDDTSKIVVKGLNGEVISGVIDTDTALARVVNTIAPDKIIVDSVSGLSVNDTFRLGNSEAFIDNSNRTISAIDSTTKTITCTNGSVANGFSGYLLETTTSSSSPVVKSQDGQAVVGTWSGLGTNEVTFTLGTNTPSLSGKDLYVTYALNMPPNNSHFPEIPYSVDKAYTETGVEMKPVTEIVIEDDFMGKVRESNNECPHMSGMSYESSLQFPSTFKDLSHQSYYQLISKLDGDTLNCGVQSLNKIPQHLFSFNLIEMVERKLGCEIPSNNKVQWLKDNVNHLACTLYCYGNNGTNNSVTLKSLIISPMRWSDGVTANLSSINKITNSTTSSSIVTNIIDEEGKCHYLLVTSPSNGTLPSNLYTDYAKLEMKLTLPSNYQALYCDNKRAREVVCNPVLVQKETKTVQRLIPSKECFATESKSGVSKSVNSSSVSHTILHKSDFVYVTTQGTGSYNSVVDDYYRECIAKLTNDPTIKSSEVINEELGRTFVDTVRFIKIPSFSYPTNTLDIHPVDLLPNIANKVFIKPYLVNASGELKIRLFIRNGKGATIPNNVERIYNIPNRPLIK